MKNRITKFFLVVLSGICMLSFSSCERDGITPVKEKFRNAPEGFSVNAFTVPSSPVNLDLGPAAISADLSDEVTWTLILTGAESKAVKTFTGLSKDVNIQWNGSHKDIYFFRAGEYIYANLSFLGSDLIMLDSFMLSKTKVYDGLLLFQRTGFDKDFVWPAFSFMETGEASTVQHRVTTKSVQGTGSFYLSGSDVNNTYFINAVRDMADLPGVVRFFDIPDINPDSIFFNVYVYGSGNPAAMGGIGVGEDENENGFYEDGQFHSEDTWDFQFRVNWTGWKLVSAPYSSFQKNSNPLYGGTGNGVREPDKIRQITFNLLSSPPANDVEIYYDFPIITIGKPFSPHQ